MSELERAAMRLIKSFAHPGRCPTLATSISGPYVRLQCLSIDEAGEVMHAFAELANAACNRVNEQCPGDGGPTAAESSPPLANTWSEWDGDTPY